jgi:polar amino acid transport system permease protein
MIVPRATRKAHAAALDKLCATVTTATVGASVVGMIEIMTLVDQALAAEDGLADPLMPLHGPVLPRCFAYRSPTARPTVRLGRRVSVPA